MAHEDTAIVEVSCMLFKLELHLRSVSLSRDILQIIQLSHASATNTTSFIKIQLEISAI
jgi:hypothetical protein